MNVSLISVSPDAEKHMAYCARVSNPNNQDNENYAGLLRYCIKHQHWSIFEQAFMTLEINTTRGLAAQILRHRSFSFQEYSQRYAEAPEQIYTREARLQDPDNRQNSISSDDVAQALRFRKLQEKVGMEARTAYNKALSDGIAKEQARALLPEGLTETTLIMSGSLRSWIHYCELRMGNGTQKEHAEIAQMCWNILSQHFPSVAAAME